MPPKSNNPITYFAETDFRNKKIRFGIKAVDRAKHVYVIGKTGMGKSTMLENMAVQDIQNGEGMAFMDPHGQTAEKLLDYIPEERIKDVVYFAPFDMEHPISFNVMEDVGYDKRHLVVSGLMSTFKKIWVDAWSARMEYILNNVLLALLEFPDATLLGVNRMLSDKDYRKKVVDNVSDPAVKSFWIDEFAKYGDKYMQEAGAAIQNKIGQFTSNPLIRNIIGQPKSSFDIRDIMDNRKIVIINLSKGRVGEQNASLLGGMLITKIYLGAMSRADVPASVLNNLPNFYLYVDEFQSFANATFADILSEARKYKLNLIIAHQYVEQMAEEVRAAVFGNVGTTITFRVGPFDAEILEKVFFPTFTKEDIVNLGFAQIYLSLMVDGVGSKPFSATTLPPITLQSISYKDSIIQHSRDVYAHPRKAVEEEIKKWHEPVIAPKPRPPILPSSGVGVSPRPPLTPSSSSSAVSLPQTNRPPITNQVPFKVMPAPVGGPRPQYSAPNPVSAPRPSSTTIPIPARPPMSGVGGPVQNSIPMRIIPKSVEFTPKPIPPKVMNLADLKKSPEQTKPTDLKGPSDKNLSSLKDMLAKVAVENKKEEKPTINQQQFTPRPITPTPIPAPSPILDKQIPREVPQHILEKILE